MKTPKIAKAMTYIDDELIVSAAKAPTKSARPMWTRWMALAAALVFVLATVFTVAQLTGMDDVNAIVALDVNPSMEIRIDKNEKVVEVAALNEEAKTVLLDMNLEKVDLNVAVNAIIGSMLKNGYLSVDRNSILVSVSSEDAQRAEALQSAIAGDIEKILGGDNIEASVITQTFEVTADVNKKAEENHISAAKATLVDRIIAAGLCDSRGVPYSYETLAGMNVNELKMLLESKAVEVGGIHSSGKAENQSYITKEDALAIALAHAGVSEGDCYGLEFEMDYNRGVMVYNVEFDTAEFEYEYDIDAKTGEIVEFDKEIHDDRNNNDRPVEEKPNENLPTDIGRDAALAAALGHAGLTEGEVRGLKVEKDFDNGVVVYDVEFETDEFEYDYEIHGESGNILKSERDVNDDRPVEEKPNENLPTDIGRDAALAAALGHAGLTEGEVRGLKVEKDFDNGVVVYDVEFETDEFEYDYEVHGESGNILKSERDVNDDRPVEEKPNENLPTDIGRDAALAAALGHAGLTETQIAGLSVERDTEDGILVYEIEFLSNDMEYEYVIHGETGEVLKRGLEKNDDIPHRFDELPREERDDRDDDDDDDDRYDDDRYDDDDDDDDDRDD